MESTKQIRSIRAQKSNLPSLPFREGQGVGFFREGQGVGFPLTKREARLTKRACERLTKCEARLTFNLVFQVFQVCQGFHLTAVGDGLLSLTPYKRRRSRSAAWRKQTGKHEPRRGSVVENCHTEEYQTTPKIPPTGRDMPPVCNGRKSLYYSKLHTTRRGAILCARPSNSPPTDVPHIPIGERQRANSECSE